MYCLFESDIFYNEEAEEEMEYIIEIAKQNFFEHYIPPRSYSSSIIIDIPNYNYIENQINLLRNKVQPDQRTVEWYCFRHNLITASNAYKAFENQTVKNQLIYEKCKPLNLPMKEEIPLIDNSDNPDVKKIEINDTSLQKIVNTNSTLHWGQKYEYLSVKIYENMYNTQVEDFGCIQHEVYKFVGASPDGINVDPQSSRYGRMLEIKNIVNRKIDGIPKKEYWIQMQLQMEVCNLNECDFLETKFTEYLDYQDYIDDSKKNDKKKGIIIHFHTKSGAPFYVYKPLELISENEISKWEDEMINLYQSEKFNYLFVKFIYWKLEEMSCVLVCRNQKWFQDNIKELESVWKIIEKERISGYEHRAPNRKTKKEDIKDYVNKSSFGCLIQTNKDLENKYSENKYIEKIDIDKNNIPYFINTKKLKDVYELDELHLK